MGVQQAGPINVGNMANWIQQLLLEPTIRFYKNARLDDGPRNRKQTESPQEIGRSKSSILHQHPRMTEPHREPAGNAGSFAEPQPQPGEGSIERQASG